MINGDPARALLWSRHDTDKIGVAVDGWQTADGAGRPSEIEFYITQNAGRAEGSCTTSDTPVGIPLTSAYHS